MLQLKVVVHISHRESAGLLHGHTLAVDVGFPDSVPMERAVAAVRSIREQIDYAVILQKEDPIGPLLAGSGGARVVVLEGVPPTIHNIFGVLFGGIPAMEVRVAEDGGPVYFWRIGPDAGGQEAPSAPVSAGAVDPSMDGAAEGD